VIGGTSAPGYRLVDNPKYPGIAADYEKTFARLKAEPAEIFLEGHGFAFALDERRAGRRPFVDPEGYRSRVAEAEKAFRDQVAKQRAEATGPAR
jgi:metallo-beta-lactamase class B